MPVSIGVIFILFVVICRYLNENIGLQIDLQLFKTQKKNHVGLFSIEGKKVGLIFKRLFSMGFFT